MDGYANVQPTPDAINMAIGQSSIAPPPNKRLCTDNSTGHPSADGGGESLPLQDGVEEGAPIEEKEEETTDRLSVVSAQKAHDESLDEAALPDDLEGYSRWDTLSGPPLERIFSLLKTGEDCKDLANVSQVSKRFRAGARKFMKSVGNRVGFERVHLIKTSEGLEVSFRFFPSNIPFHDIRNLDWSRFERSMEGVFPILKATLTGAEDPIVERVVALLSDLICIVDIRYADADYLKLCLHLTRASIIDQIFISYSDLDDDTAPSIISLASQAKTVNIQLERGEDSVMLSDPATFIEQIYTASSRLTLGHKSPSFFGLANSFWKSFLDELLSTGCAKWVEVGMIGRTIRRAPVDFTEDQIKRLKWERVEE